MLPANKSYARTGKRIRHPHFRVYSSSQWRLARPRDELLLGSMAEFTSPLILLINKDAIRCVSHLVVAQFLIWLDDNIHYDSDNWLRPIKGYSCRHINYIFKQRLYARKDYKHNSNLYHKCRKRNKTRREKIEEDEIFFIRDTISYTRICHVTRKQKLTFDRSSPTYRCTYLSLDFMLTIISYQ